MNKPTKQLRIAVVGIGNIGRHHIRNLHSFPFVDVIGIVDTDAKICRQIGKQYGCKSYRTIEQLLYRQRPDAVIISAPTRFHAEIAKKTIAEKIPTFIEKPIAATVKDAKAIIALAKKNKTLLFVGHIERFNSAVVKVKELLEKKEIGKVISLVSRRVGLFPPRSPDTNVVIDLAVHDIDIFSYLLGQNPDIIYASGGKILLQHFEDHADIFLHYPSGSNGYIQVSWITPVKMRNLSITGTRGLIELDYINQTIQIVHNNLIDSVFDSFGQFVLKSQPSKKFLLSEAHEEPLKLELLDFLNSVAYNQPASIPGEVGLAALIVAEEAITAIRRKN